MPTGTEQRSTRWGKVHAWWLHRADLDADHLAVLAALSTYADPEGYCEPSQSTLARQLRRSRPWVNRVIAELSQRGLITKEARKRKHNNGTTSCRYQLRVDPPADVAPVRPMTERVVEANTPCHRDDTNQQAQEQIQTTHCSAGDGKPGNDPNRPAREAHAGERDGRSVEVAGDWAPSPLAMDRGRQLCPDVDLAVHAAMFVYKCRAKGYRCLPERIDDSWLSWLANDCLRDARNIQPVAGRPARLAVRANAANRAQERFEAWAMASRMPKPQSSNSWS